MPLQKVPRSLATLLKLGIAAAAFVWLIRSDRLRFGELQQADLLPLLLIATPLLLVNLLAQALRWWYLVRLYGLDMTLGRCLKYSWIGNFFALVLPGAAGSELARGYYLWKDDPGRRNAGVLSVVLDRFLGLLLFFGFSSVAYVLILHMGGGNRALQVQGLASVVVFLGVSALGWSLLHTGLGRRVSRILPARLSAALGAATEEYRHRTAHVAAAIGLSGLAAGSMIAAFVAVAAALGDPVSPLTALLGVPFVVTANSLPLTPGGLGLGESAASAAFAAHGYANGAEVMLVVRAILALLRLPGFLLYLTHRPPERASTPPLPER